MVKTRHELKAWDGKGEDSTQRVRSRFSGERSTVDPKAKGLECAYEEIENTLDGVKKKLYRMDWHR